MRRSDAFWEIFMLTGYIGAYLIYKDCKSAGDQEFQPEIMEFSEG